MPIHVELVIEGQRDRYRIATIDRDVFQLAGDGIGPSLEEV